MEIYKNCPNCGGALDDTGRCKYCGSKIYDFCDIDTNERKKTYLRVKHQNKIIIAQVIANPNISLKCEAESYPIIEVEFEVIKATIKSEEI